MSCSTNTAWISGHVPITCVVGGIAPSAPPASGTSDGLGGPPSNRKAKVALHRGFVLKEHNRTSSLSFFVNRWELLGLPGLYCCRVGLISPLWRALWKESQSICILSAAEILITTPNSRSKSSAIISRVESAKEKRSWRGSEPMMTLASSALWLLSSFDGRRMRSLVSSSPRPPCNYFCTHQNIMEHP